MAYRPNPEDEAQLLGGSSQQQGAAAPWGHAEGSGMGLGGTERGPDGEPGEGATWPSWAQGQSHTWESEREGGAELPLLSAGAPHSHAPPAPFSASGPSHPQGGGGAPGLNWPPGFAPVWGASATQGAGAGGLQAQAASAAFGVPPGAPGSSISSGDAQRPASGMGPPSLGPSSYQGSVRSVPGGGGGGGGMGGVGGGGGGGLGGGSGAGPVVVKKKRIGDARSWIVINHRGECSMLEAGKGTIMKRCELPGRDLRLLDPRFVYPSTILGREKAIVVNLESLRCIITADEVLLLNTDSPTVQQYKTTLLRRLLLVQSAATMSSAVTDGSPGGWRKGAPGAYMGNNGLGYMADEEDLPFEFKALELAIELTISSLDFQAQELCRESFPLLDQLTAHISTVNLEKVRSTKSRLLSITGRVQKVRMEIEQLMDDDGDMAEMYLTEKRVRAEASASYAMRQSSGAGFPHSHSRRGAPGAHGVHPEGDFRGTSGDTDSQGPFGSVCHSAPTSPVGSPSLRSGFAGPGAHRMRRGGHEEGLEGGDEGAGRGSARGSAKGSMPWGSEGESESVSESLSIAPIVDNVETLEMLLENYFVVIEGTLNKLTQLSQYIEDTEDFINIQLDNVRNQLIQFELIMTTAAFVVALWGVVAGIFGMNVPLGVEEDNSALRWILVDSGFGGILIFAGFLWYFRYKNWTM